MAAAAHSPGGYGGVPQSVGKDFNEADKGTGILKGPRARRKSRLNAALDDAIEKHGKHLR